MKSTQLNSEINKTVLNRQNTNATSINMAVSSRGDLPEKTVLLGKYIVGKKLDERTGEADLYYCTCDNKEYVAKVYRREAAIKNEIIEKLKKLNSPYVAKLCGIGTYNGFPFEIMPYYRKGSLAYRIGSHRFSLKELKEIIPQLNEALYTLHKNGILHKDLKPSNIMTQDDEKHIALIDFGVSSVVDSNNTVVVTRTGMTPEYSAPEASLNVFLEESDYYSLGITLYELFAGHTPFKNMSDEQKVQFAVTQALPFSSDMPKELVDLIRGLTYNDLTHRNDRNNPNRRWTYEEVNRWCKGEKQAVPGAADAAVSAIAMPPYEFMEKSYTDVHSLTVAMAGNWEGGKKQLFRRLLSGFFKGFSPKLAGYCIDAEEQANGTGTKDKIFFDFIYRFDENLTEFYWKGRHWETLPEFGKEILKKMRFKDYQEAPMWGEILSCNCLSSYAQKFIPDAVPVLRSLEASAKPLTGDGFMGMSVEAVRCLYSLGYLLSGDKTFVYEDRTFSSLEEYVEFLKEQLARSKDDFLYCCKAVINGNSKLDPQFEAWLVALGKADGLEKWKKEIRKGL